MSRSRHTSRGRHVDIVIVTLHSPYEWKSVTKAGGDSPTVTSHRYRKLEDHLKCIISKVLRPAPLSIMSLA